MLKNFTDLSQKLQIQMKLRLYGIRKFEILAKWSNLKEHSWKNTYYRKQNATPEMIEYWCFLYPQDAVAITGEKYESKNATQCDADIKIPLEKIDASSIEHRAIWTINNWLQCNNIKKKDSAEYLNEKSKFQTCIEVKTTDWKSLLSGTTKLTIEMLLTIATWNPAFKCWILTGTTEGLTQVNPNDLLTLHKRQAEEREYYSQLLNANKNSMPTDEEPHLEQIYFEEEMRAASNRYVNNSH